MGKCFNSTIVNAPIEKVWEVIGNFHDLSWAKGMDLSVKVVGELRADQIGTKRVINEAFHETLLELSDLNHTRSYCITDGPGPVAKDQVKNYIGTIQLLANTSDNTTFVTWTSSFDSPNEGAVAELCNPIYQAALKGLKEYFGQG